MLEILLNERGTAMLKRAFLALALLAGGMPANAMQPGAASGQQPPENAAAPDIADTAAATEKPIATETDEARGWQWPKIWFQFDLAPEIAQQDPFSGDSQTSDSTDVKWTLGLSENLGDFLMLELKFGPVATIDSDRDATASSRLVGSISLRTQPLLSNVPPEGSGRANPRVALNLSALFNYQAALRYIDFFSDRDGTEHTFDVGASLQVKFPRAELTLDAVPRRVESTLPASDYSSFRLVPRLKVPLVEGIRLVASGEAERRWYDHVDPIIGRERRDWRFQGFAGFDFAGLINNCLGMELLGEAVVGARMIDIGSNVPGQDRSTLKFAGSLRISVPLSYRIKRSTPTGRCGNARTG